MATGPGIRITNGDHEIVVSPAQHRSLYPDWVEVKPAKTPKTPKTRKTPDSEG